MWDRCVSDVGAMRQRCRSDAAAMWERCRSFAAAMSERCGSGHACVARVVRLRCGFGEQQHGRSPRCLSCCCEQDRRSPARSCSCYDQQQHRTHLRARARRGVSSSSARLWESGCEAVCGAVSAGMVYLVLFLEIRILFLSLPLPLPLHCRRGGVFCARGGGRAPGWVARRPRAFCGPRGFVCASVRCRGVALGGGNLGRSTGRPGAQKTRCL